MDARLAGAWALLVARLRSPMQHLALVSCQ
jgi:hypothetical protein